MPTTLQLAEPDFLYVGGDPALDLVNTVDWTSRGPEEDRLFSYDQVVRWAEGAGVLDAAAGRRLRHLASTRQKPAGAALAFAHRVRDVLHDLFGAIARGEPSAAALTSFNSLLAQALERLELAPESRAGYRWRWRDRDSDLRSPLWPVLWSAAKLLESDEVGGLRICDGDDCGWMYVDRSRNGLRRWCQMRTCGTREKSRRRRGD